MNKYIKPFFILVFLGSFYTKALAGFGIYQSFVIIGGVYYDLYADTNNPDFKNNLGSFMQGGTWIFTGGEINTYKENQSGCPGGNVCSGTTFLSVKKLDGTPIQNYSMGLTFNMNLNINGCSQNQKFDKTNGSSNIISGLAPGDYMIEVYSDATGSQNNNINCNDNITQAVKSATFTILAPAPVSWAGFDLMPKDQGCMLSWSTASEENCDYFTVERSFDGVNFEAIGSLQGAGTTQLKKFYTFEDRYPSDGINYYRIRQTDYDKKYSYSPIRSFKFEKRVKPKLFPNITSSFIKLSLPEIKQESVNYGIFNFNNSQLLKRIKIEPGAYETVIGVSDLPCGSYLLISEEPLPIVLPFIKN